MFKHPASTHTARRAYGHIRNGWQTLQTKKAFPLSASGGAAFAAHLRSKGISLPTDTLPSGSVLVAHNQLGTFTDAVVYWLNGNSVQFELDSGDIKHGGVGSGALASSLEAFLDTYDGSVDTVSFDTVAEATAHARTLWGTDGAPTSDASSRAAPTSDASTSETDNSSDAGDEDALAQKSWFAPSAAADEKPKTGYYTDSGGYAWYYNAEKDYMEAVAAPKGTFSTQPRFDASKSADKYASMKGVLKSSALASRTDAVSNATSDGGVELPAAAAGRSTPVSAPPADVAARGEEQKKQQIKTGFKGAVSAVPTWAWITLGTLTAAGGGYFVYRRFYKK